MANQHHCLEISRVYITDTDNINTNLFPDDSYCSIIASLTAGDNSRIEKEKNVDMDGYLKYSSLVFAINDPAQDNQQLLDINLKNEVQRVFDLFRTRENYYQARIRINEDLFLNQNADGTVHYRMDMTRRGRQGTLNIFCRFAINLPLSRFLIRSSSNDLLYWLRSILRTFGSQIDTCVGAPYESIV